MNNLKRWFSIALVSGLAVLLLVGVLALAPAFAQGPGGMMGQTQGLTGTTPFGPGGMMGGSGMMGGPGWMMGQTQGLTGTTPFGPGGMMGGMMSQMMSGMMNGMMGGMMTNSNSPFFTAQPLALAEATETLNAYLTSLNDNNLVLGEVMIFDNHAYAQIVEKDSGIGVMEVLIDPTTKTVVPEMGPNMMWNLKYGMMSGFGDYGMMGGFGNMMGQAGAADLSAEMPVTPEQAVEAAQTYLDTYFSEAKLTTDLEADAFYGYYTLHVNKDGQTAGMLSVNGYTGQVFPHTWHGKLLEMNHQ